MVDLKQQISFFWRGGRGWLKVFTACLNLVARMVDHHHHHEKIELSPSRTQSNNQTIRHGKVYIHSFRLDHVSCNVASFVSA